jgi:hypothetical protein
MRRVIPPTRLVAGALTLLALCVLAAAMAGCGSSGDLPAIAAASPTATSLKVKVLTIDKYGFKMAYPVGWVGTHYERATPGGPEGTLQYLIAFADPKGAQAEGAYLDSEQVAVYQLAKPMKPRDLTKEVANRLVYHVFLKDIPDVSPRSNWRAINVYGLPGWQVIYEYSAHGKEVTAQANLITRGNRAYVLTQQSEIYAQRKVAYTLQTVLGYFRLL